MREEADLTEWRQMVMKLKVSQGAGDHSPGGQVRGASGCLLLGAGGAGACRTVP